MNKKEMIERLNKCLTDCDNAISYYKKTARKRAARTICK